MLFFEVSRGEIKDSDPFSPLFCFHLSTTVEPPLMATFPHFPASGLHIHSYFNLSVTVTSPQRQQLLKRFPTAKIGRLRSYYSDAEDNVDLKNEFTFYLQIYGYS